MRSSVKVARNIDEVARNLVKVVRNSDEVARNFGEVVHSRIGVGRNFAEVAGNFGKVTDSGGKVGGKRRLETLTQDQRSEIAFRAAKARWNNAKKP